MTEYGIEKFIGYFLIFFPCFMFVLICILRGGQVFIGRINSEIEDNEREKRNFFHHHYHYKAKRD